MFRQTVFFLMKEKTLTKTLDLKQRRNVFLSRVYSEEQPGDAATALFIKKLSEEDAGEYRCTAVYASNQRLEARVDISVYSK